MISHRFSSSCLSIFQHFLSTAELQEYRVFLYLLICLPLIVTDHFVLLLYLHRNCISKLWTTVACWKHFNRVWPDHSRAWGERWHGGCSIGVIHITPVWAVWRSQPEPECQAEACPQSPFVTNRNKRQGGAREAFKNCLLWTGRPEIIHRTLMDSTGLR